MSDTAPATPTEPGAPPAPSGPPTRGHDGWVALAFVPAVALDGLAAWSVADGINDGTAMFRLVALHLAASLACAWPFWRGLPAEMQSPQRPLMALGAVANLFVPLLAIGMLVALRVGLKLRRIARRLPFDTIAQPQFELHRKSEGSQMRNSRLRSRLMDPDTPMAERVTDLLSLQDVPSRVTADMMRSLLADRVEDLRLLAYGMLDGREKSISHRIFAEEAQLQHSEDRDHLFGTHKRLAELYFELVFQRLVDGDMRTHACKQAREQAERALVLRADDAGLWFLLARVLHALKDYDAGEQALARAEQHGFPRERLLPWIAEYAFARRRFEAVAAAFGELPVAPGAMQLAAVWHYWTRR